MIHFNDLRITCPLVLHIDAWVDAGQPISFKEVFIDTDLTIQSETEPSGDEHQGFIKLVPTESEILSDGKHLRMTRDLSEYFCNQADQRMFFVYLNYNGSPSPATPCDEDREYVMKATVNLAGVYQKALDFMKCAPSCGCSDKNCEVSTQFANFALEYFRLVSSLDLGRNAEGMDAFNRLLGRDSKNTNLSNCGCNGSK